MTAPALDDRGRTGLLTGVLIMLIGLNLRPAITSVGPVLDQVRGSLAVSATWAGVLTALPVLCFASGGLTAPFTAGRLGRTRTIGLALALLTGGLVLRALGGAAVVIIGTALAALGVALLQVLLPSLIKDRFGDRVGLISGGYTAALQGGAAIGFVLTPLFAGWLLGWRPAWVVWAIPAAVALVVWVVASRRTGGSDAPSARSVTTNAAGPPGERSLLRVPLAWIVTTFFGLQALVAFVMLGWLPQLLLSAGVDRTTAGLLAGLLSALAVPISLLVPPLAARGGQSGWIAGLTLCGMAGVTGLIFAPATAPVLWTILVGLGLSVFSLAITIIALRTSSGRDTAALSGMAQGFGYLFAGAGPFLFGLLFDLTGRWTVPLSLIMVVLVLQLITGILAGRPRTV